MLRNHCGHVEGLLLGYIGWVSSDEAEGLAIKFALELVFKPCKYVHNNLVVETDSMVAVAWILKKNSRPWALMDSLNAIYDLCAAMVRCH